MGWELVKKIKDKNNVIYTLPVIEDKYVQSIGSHISRGGQPLLDLTGPQPFFFNDDRQYSNNRIELSGGTLIGIALYRDTSSLQRWCFDGAVYLPDSPAMTTGLAHSQYSRFPYYIGFLINNELRYAMPWLYYYIDASWVSDTTQGNYSWFGHTSVTESIDRVMMTKLYDALVPAIVSDTIAGNGGGCTHIAKVDGQLSELSLRLNDVLIVAGGGGGGLLLGRQGWDGSITDVLYSGSSNKMTAEVTNSTIIFNMYIESQLIYTFTSPIGTLPQDSGKIYLSFLIDDEHQVGKPSLVYNMGDGSYEYNQENPTDQELSDIYTWLSAGLST